MQFSIDHPSLSLSGLATNGTGTTDAEQGGLPPPRTQKQAGPRPFPLFAEQRAHLQCVESIGPERQAAVIMDQSTTLMASLGVFVSGHEEDEEEETGFHMKQSGESGAASGKTQSPLKARDCDFADADECSPLKRRTLKRRTLVPKVRLVSAQRQPQSPQSPKGLKKNGSSSSDAARDDIRHTAAKKESKAACVVVSKEEAGATSEGSMMLYMLTCTTPIKVALKRAETEGRLSLAGFAHKFAVHQVRSLCWLVY